MKQSLLVINTELKVSMEFHLSCQDTSENLYLCPKKKFKVCSTISINFFSLVNLLVVSLAF